MRLDLIRSAVLEAGLAEIRPEIPAWLPVSLDGNGAEAGDGAASE